MAYWVSNKFIKIFEANTVADYAEVQEGLKTGDNERFIRFWYEIEMTKSNMFNIPNSKWFYHTKGGGFRKWYGNQMEVLNYEGDGRELKSFKGSSLTGKNNYFLPCISYSRITSDKTGFRYTEAGSIPNMAGIALYPKQDNMYLYLGWLNTKIIEEILNITNPTINYSPGTIARLPIDLNIFEKIRVEKFAKDNIALSKTDWDSFETSWDFKRHPLIPNIQGVWNLEELQKKRNGENVPLHMWISASYEVWEEQCDRRFTKLKANEEELNRIFIDIYGLQDELTPEVEDKDITVRKADLGRDIRSFISYAVGCMFGRYSIYREGLMYAGGEWNLEDYKFAAYEASNPNGYPKDMYSSQWILPDEDNIIPITDEEYFSDDIVSRFVDFVKTVYGQDTLEDNLDFIAQALGGKGDTSREVIRNYFVKDFYADHLKVYQKRPIYWLFDSGKQNGFKALIYMHRYDADTVGRVRTDYLHQAQKYVESAMQSAQYTIENASSSSDKSKATKAVTKYTKQLAEMKIYDEAIAHIANRRIEIDLDDGVKVNYAKFQGVEVAQEGKKALKVDLLGKI